MDIINPNLKKRKLQRTVIIGAVAVVLLGVAAVGGASLLRPALPEVDRDSVWIDAVSRGEMLREVRAPGTLVPRDVRWLSSATSAQVAKIEILPGARVEKDTVLLRLSNPEVENGLRNAEAQVAAAEAQVSAKRAALQSQLLDQRASMAQARSEYAAAKVRVDAEAKAAEMQVIPRVQYQQSLIALEQLEYRVRIEEQRVDTFATGIRAQVAAAQGALQQERSNLTLRQSQADALAVRAGLEGVLQAMVVQEGQQVAKGAELARVARPDVLIARLLVPEIQAKDITLGMAAEADTYNGVVAGTVSRIDPAVVDGSVRVDVTLTGPLPPGARPDLSVDGRIRIAKLDDVLSVGRPADARAHDTGSLFRIDPSGDTATRVPVRIGALSVNRAQVLQGLEIGDQVILSDTGQWDKYDRIRLR